MTISLFLAIALLSGPGHSGENEDCHAEALGMMLKARYAVVVGEYQKPTLLS